MIDKTIVRGLLKALDSSPVFHPVHHPRQPSGKFGRGGSMKPHRKTRDNIFMANAGNPARLAATMRAEPPKDKAAVIRGMLATLGGIQGTDTDFDPQDHPHAPAGSSTGGQVVAKGGGSGSAGSESAASGKTSKTSTTIE